MFIWCAAFAVNNRVFGNRITVADRKARHEPSINALDAGQWFDLIGLLLFLASGVMGVVCFFLDRRRVRS